MPISVAYPLRSIKGIGASNDGFLESLHHDGFALARPRRARVNPRQCFAFAQAGRFGWTMAQRHWAAAAAAASLMYTAVPGLRFDVRIRSALSASVAPASTFYYLVSAIAALESCFR